MEQNTPGITNKITFQLAGVRLAQACPNHQQGDTFNHNLTSKNTEIMNTADIQSRHKNYFSGLTFFTITQGHPRGGVVIVRQIPYLCL